MLRCFAQCGTSTLFRCNSRYPGNKGQWIDQHTRHVLSNGKEQPMLAHNGEQKAVRGAAIRKGVGNKVSGKANKVVQLFWGCFVWLWASNFDQFLFQKSHDLDDPYQFDMLNHQSFHHVHWFCCWFAWMDWIAFKILMFFMHFGMETLFTTLLYHQRFHHFPKLMPKGLIPKVIWWRISTPLEMMNTDTVTIGSFHDQNLLPFIPSKDQENWLFN